MRWFTRRREMDPVLHTQTLDRLRLSVLMNREIQKKVRLSLDPHQSEAKKKTATTSEKR